MIVRSEKFYREILEHPIPTDLEAPKLLPLSRQMFEPNLPPILWIGAWIGALSLFRSY